MANVPDYSQYIAVKKVGVAQKGNTNISILKGRVAYRYDGYFPLYRSVRLPVNALLSNKFTNVPTTATVPAFLPTDIAGTALWLDAADSSSFTLTGNNVTAITDKSGTKIVSIVSTPTYNATLFNGLPAFVFGSGTRFSVTTTALGQNFTLIGVFRVTGFTGPSGNAAPLSVGAPNSGTETAIGWNLGSSGYNLYDFGFGESLSTAVNTINVNLIQVGVKSSTSPNLLTTINGTTGSSGTSSYSNTNTTINIGNAGTNFGFLGNIAEAIVYSVALTNSQRQQIEGYLAWKWGLQGSLPANHPYKNSRP